MILSKCPVKISFWCLHYSNSRSNLLTFSANAIFVWDRGSRGFFRVFFRVKRFFSPSLPPPQQKNPASIIPSLRYWHGQVYCDEWLSIRTERRIRWYSASRCSWTCKWMWWASLVGRICFVDVFNSATNFGHFVCCFACLQPLAAHTPLSLGQSLPLRVPPGDAQDPTGPEQRMCVSGTEAPHVLSGCVLSWHSWPVGTNVSTEGAVFLCGLHLWHLMGLHGVGL